ncbi:MAG: CHAT domain-containing protein [Candidatus Rokubacteria bacterium]|nr:CHAT domain-containing protein [Candidatus Rokubacteria bacterium]
MTDPERARRRLEIAQLEYRAFLDRMRKENLEQVSLMTVEPVTVQEVQRILPEGTTLVEFLVSERETVAWVIDRGHVEVVILPLPRAELVAEVRAFREAIGQQAAIEEVERQAGALYQSLLAPARPHIRGEHLLIVPHDVLHYLPFGALRSPEGRWLVEDFTLANLPSASVLKYLQGKGADAPGRVLAVGNPVLGPALNLRWAEREARAVGERLPRATVLVRQAATEARVKTLAGDMGLLHFATHGELNQQEPLSSALLLAPEGMEDGRLEVRELFALDLHARLVVLSACETGLGKLSRGDELVGLQRAFLYAGTPAVVTTLWKVDDRSSFLLMRAFYNELTQGRGPADALRQAQRQVTGEFPHPFAWAAFGLTGVPR